jgi:hypothetical protein
MLEDPSMKAILGGHPITAVAVPVPRRCGPSMKADFSIEATRDASRKPYAAPGRAKAPSG